MKLRYLLGLAAAFAASAPVAAGQFTAAVSPLNSRTPAQAKAKADSAKLSDSVSVVRRMTDMKGWVDSVALALGERPASDSAPRAGDTTAVATAGGDVTTSRAKTKQERETTTAFRNGAPAPATATDLPLFAVLGVGAIVAGALLRRL